MTNYITDKVYGKEEQDISVCIVRHLFAFLSKLGLKSASRYTITFQSGIVIKIEFKDEDV